ncbi:MAG TPA: hypothetical protein VML55_19115 [Planctomycetaceae bacterium]|nr:hypothetical protein [Planctomycetaceae bacterium]
MPRIGRLSGTKDFRFSGIAAADGREVAEFAVTCAVSFDASAEASGVRLRGILTTRESSGTARVDAASGRLVSLESKATLSGTVSVELGGQMYAVPTQQT